MRRERGAHPCERNSGDKNTGIISTAGKVERFLIGGLSVYLQLLFIDEILRSITCYYCKEQKSILINFPKKH